MKEQLKIALAVIGVPLLAAAIQDVFFHSPPTNVEFLLMIGVAIGAYIVGLTG